MNIRGTRTVTSVQVDELADAGLSSLQSASLGIDVAYIDLQQYLNNTEYNKLVEQVIEVHTDIDILCLFI